MRQLILTFIVFVALFTSICQRTPNANTQPPKGMIGMIGKSKLDPRWIYISKYIPWQAPPKEVIEDMGSRLFYDGSGSVWVLYPSGELAILACDFRKIPETNQLSLNGVVTFSIFTGTWSRNTDGAITMVSKFCFTSMGRDQSNEPTVERRYIVGQQASDRVAGLLTSSEESMVPLPDNFRDVEGIEYMLRFASRCG